MIISEEELDKWVEHELEYMDEVFIKRPRYAHQKPAFLGAKCNQHKCKQGWHHPLRNKKRIMEIY